ncbi:histidine kinase [Halobellus sp. Atlit-31R]|nr:histidine kinase [Halobellus sp. Atlit-31R]
MVNMIYYSLDPPISRMDPLRVAHVGVFGAAALVCAASLLRADRITDTETRWGMVALLVCSSTWAATDALRLVVPGVDLKILLYLVGLVAGLSSVWAWLYFCSAYTGHGYHRHPTVRWVGAAVFVFVVVVKLTNPLHGLYFTTSFTTEPFRHLAIELSTAHWIVTGLAYALTAVGFYLLYEVFTESQLETSMLGGLVGITAVPVVFNLVAYSTPGPFIAINYEPIGVAVFAVGVLYAVDEQFVAVPRFWRNHVVETLDDAVVLITHDGVVRDANDAAVATFPVLAEAVGEPLATAVPELEPVLRAGDEIVAIDGDSKTRYFLCERAPVTSGTQTVGEVLICTEVTKVERQRRELQRQNEQFDDFADAITHELRNTLSIAEGYLDVAGTAVSDDTPERVADAHETIAESLDRMDRIVGELWTLAHYGQMPEELGYVDLRAAAGRAWRDAAYPEMDLIVESDAAVAADESRLVELFANVFEFAAVTDSTRVAVTAADGHITVVTDGDPIPEEKVTRAFEYGEAVPTAEAGLLLPTVRTLCRVHRWSVDVDPAVHEGVRLDVSGVETRERVAGAAG